MLQQQHLLQELLALHPLLPLSNNFTDKEAADLTASFSHPTVLKYFRVLANNAMRDVMMNEYEQEDQRIKIAARFNKLKGILMVCHNIISTYSQHMQQTSPQQRR